MSIDGVTGLGAVGIEHVREVKGGHDLLESFRQSEAIYRQDYYDFLRFPSISGDPEHEKDVRDCCQWLHNYLENMGLAVETWETPGNPVVYAEYLGAGPEKPTLLIYNHYDVQPVTNPDDWNTPPFEPTVQGSKIFCRGAQDNKGQCFYVMSALRSLLERDGALPINVKLLIDGEEERGSAGLSSILEEKESRLKADTLAIVDLGIEGRNDPSLCFGIRGIVGFDVWMQGANTDLHSGERGGLVKNPNLQLALLLGTLVNSETGAVNVPGFYDSVTEPTEEEKSQIDLSFDPIAFLEEYGVPADGGEKAYSPMERVYFRPTLDVNGMQGGTVGSKSKTVIPSIAQAHLTCRLVPNQDPNKIGELVAQCLRQRAPKDLHFTVTVRPGKGWPARSDPNSKSVQAASRAYEEVFGKPCKYTMSGGTIGIASLLTRASEGTLVLMGLGLEEDNMHSANESFDWPRIEEGVLSMVRFIEKLAESTDWVHLERRETEDPDC